MQKRNVLVPMKITENLLILAGPEFHIYYTGCDWSLWPPDSKLHYLLKIGTVALNTWKYAREEEKMATSTGEGSSRSAPGRYRWALLHWAAMHRPALRDKNFLCKWNSWPLSKFSFFTEIMIVVSWQRDKTCAVIMTACGRNKWKPSHFLRL